MATPSGRWPLLPQHLTGRVRLAALDCDCYTSGGAKGLSLSVCGRRSFHGNVKHAFTTPAHTTHWTHTGLIGATVVAQYLRSKRLQKKKTFPRPLRYNARKQGQRSDAYGMTFSYQQFSIPPVPPFVASRKNGSTLVEDIVSEIPTHRIGIPLPFVIVSKLPDIADTIMMATRSIQDKTK